MNKLTDLRTRLLWADNTLEGEQEEKYLNFLINAYSDELYGTVIIDALEEAIQAYYGSNGREEELYHVIEQQDHSGSSYAMLAHMLYDICGINLYEIGARSL